MLTKLQIEQRAGKLTASRVACLMTGDADAILRLYREMIGEEVPEDLSHVWPVQLGSATEALNLDWFEQVGNPLSRRGEVVIHPKYPWAAATLDAWCVDLKCPIETKHVGGREPLEVVIDRYQPQMQWQMEVTGAAQCALSVIMGANPPIVEFITRDWAYAKEMLARGKQFMDCIAARRVPVALPPVTPPVDASKLYAMDDNPTWIRYAQQWLQTYGAAQTAKDCEKVLKELVPADAKKCFGSGIQITRDRAGRLSLREKT